MNGMEEETTFSFLTRALRGGSRGSIRKEVTHDSLLSCLDDCIGVSVGNAVGGTGLEPKRQPVLETSTWE